MGKVSEIVGLWVEYEDKLYVIRFVSDTGYGCQTIIFNDYGPVRYGELAFFSKEILDEVIDNELENRAKAEPLEREKLIC